MTKLILDGSIRSKLGTAPTKKIRRENQIPAVIYNGKENIHIAVDKKEFVKQYSKGNIQSKIIELSLDKKKLDVLTYQLDIHPSTDLPRHIDFIQVQKGKKLKVLIPINFIEREKSPGIKKGGFLNIVKRRVQLWCDPENIPNHIEIKISKMNIGDAIKATDVTFPDNTKPVDKKNFALATITGRGKSKDDEENKEKAVEEKKEEEKKEEPKKEEKSKK